jgi:hypothetical protein
MYAFKSFDTSGSATKELGSGSWGKFIFLVIGGLCHFLSDIRGDSNQSKKRGPTPCPKALAKLMGCCVNNLIPIQTRKINSQVFSFARSLLNIFCMNVKITPDKNPERMPKRHCHNLMVQYGASSVTTGKNKRLLKSPNNVHRK